MNDPMLANGSKYEIDHGDWVEKIKILTSGPKETTVEYRHGSKGVKDVWSRSGVKRMDTARVLRLVEGQVAS